MKAVRGDKLTDVEARALGVANTTTSTTFCRPSVDQDGVNNAEYLYSRTSPARHFKRNRTHIFICTRLCYQSLKGVIKFPYKVSNTKPIAKAELSANEDASFRWAILELDIYNQTISVNLTYEIEALAIEQFTGYCFAEISQAIREATSEILIWDRPR